MLFYKARCLTEGETSSGSPMDSQDIVLSRAVEENSVYEYRINLFPIKIQKVCKSRIRFITTTSTYCFTQTLQSGFRDCLCDHGAWYSSVRLQIVLALPYILYN